MTKIFGKPLLLIVTMLVAVASAGRLGSGAANLEDIETPWGGTGGNTKPEFGDNPGGNVALGAVDQCSCKCTVGNGVEGVFVTTIFNSKKTCMPSQSVLGLLARGQATCSTCDETP